MEMKRSRRFKIFDAHSPLHSPFVGQQLQHHLTQGLQGVSVHLHYNKPEKCRVWEGINEEKTKMCAGAQTLFQTILYVKCKKQDPGVSIEKMTGKRTLSR